MEKESYFRSKNPALPLLFSAIDTSLQAIYHSSQQIASLEQGDSISLFSQNILAHESIFLSYMERIVKAFELEANNQVDLLQRVVYGLNAFLAIMFFLSFYGIIRPMFSRLDTQNKSLTDKNEALKKQQHRLEEQATYIREQNGQLVQAKKKAEQEAAAKTAFLSNMSHEIRTPMNAVIGMTNILLQSTPRPDQLDHLKTIGFSAENLLVVINDILDFSKIEAGKLEIEHVNFNILEACQNIYRTLEAKAQDKNLHFRLDFDEDIPNFVVGDPTRLSQILINLLNNALKFTPKGHVIFQVKKLHNGDGEVILQFMVQDTGIGIPKEKQNMIFESFSQTDTKTTRIYGGTGLGLAIT
ncbi:MAG: ATP-binding protein, partial [Bacteroidota bacterium]